MEQSAVCLASPNTFGRRLKARPISFLQRVHISRSADRCNSQTISVYPSVRPYVCPSHSGVLFRRIKIRSCGFQHLVGQSF